MYLYEICESCLTRLKGPTALKFRDSHHEMSEEEVHFSPPSLPKEDKLKTFTYHSAPKDPLNDEPVVMGIDEAGRGPVLGPMVYALAYAPKSHIPELNSHGYNDSKVLKADVRLEMFKDVLKSPKNEKAGWATTVMTAHDIGEGMLRPFNPYNLNAQAHDTTMDLIQLVLDAGTSIAELYVDTVGPPDKYQAKLKQRFPQIEKIVVTKKADSIYPIVSLASICAKVTRDLSLEDQLTDNCGSGYPSDPNTVKWLERNFDKVFGWGDLVRYSWGTAQNMLQKRGVPVTWPEEEEQGGRPSTMSFRTKPGTLPKVGMNRFGIPL